MKAASFVGAVSIVVIANAFALIHAARNRTGSPEAEVTLTQRELQYPRRLPSDDDSGVTLNLAWAAFSYRDYPDWVDERMLQRLDFDCSVNPDSADAERFYRRQQPRRAFVALENDGPGWLAWLQRAGTSSDPLQLNLNRSHLVAVDADRDAGKLRVRNPDRTKVLILPAVISLTFASQPGSTFKIRGSIQELPSSIHVPRPFSDAFHRLAPPPMAAPQSLFYQVHLRCGRAFEPIVTGVDFTK